MSILQSCQLLPFEILNQSGLRDDASPYPFISIVPTSDEDTNLFGSTNHAASVTINGVGPTTIRHMQNIENGDIRASKLISKIDRQVLSAITGGPMIYVDEALFTIRGRRSDGLPANTLPFWSIELFSLQGHTCGSLANMAATFAEQ
jgi:hypothetical protein